MTILEHFSIVTRPYVDTARGDSKAYGFEMDDAAHRRLVRVLNKCRGQVAVSGYRCDLTDELFTGWRRYDAPHKQCHSIKQVRKEALCMIF